MHRIATGAGASCLALISCVAVMSLLATTTGAALEMTSIEMVSRIALSNIHGLIMLPILVIGKRCISAINMSTKSKACTILVAFLAAYVATFALSLYIHNSIDSLTPISMDEGWAFAGTSLSMGFGITGACVSCCGASANSFLLNRRAQRQYTNMPHPMNVHLPLQVPRIVLHMPWPPHMPPTSEELASRMSLPGNPPPSNDDAPRAPIAF